MKPDIHKFEWREIFNDSKGRTSPGKIVGFFACISSVLVFSVASLEAVFSHPSEGETNAILTTITMQSVALFTVGSTLLAIRRFTQDKDTQPDNDTQLPS